ncbi:MAG: hypothetical protein HY658_14340, partial [Actinobacteria bacterium]|nr:hypothetical protein [Actinomycetota bacterium]
MSDIRTFPSRAPLAAGPGPVRAPGDGNGTIVPFSAPAIGEAEEQAVLAAMRSGRLSA